MLLEIVRYVLIAVLAVVVWRQFRPGRASDEVEVVSRGEKPAPTGAIVLPEVVVILILLFVEAEE